MGYEVPYPNNLPTEAFRDSWDIFTRGEVVQRRADLGLALWNCQGYLQGQLLGAGEPANTWGDAAPLTDAQALQAMQDFANGQVVSGSPDAVAVGPLVKPLLKWIVTYLIERFLS